MNANRPIKLVGLILLMFVCIIVGYMIGQIPFTMVLLKSFSQNPELGTDALKEFSENPDFAAFGIEPNVGFFTMLLPFVAAFMVIIFLFPLLHKRPFKSLITSKRKIDWRRVFFAFFLWLLLGLCIEGYFFLTHQDLYSFQFNVKKFLPLLAMSLLLLPIQTSVEELVFRGYLMQGFAHLANSKIFALLLTSIIFGLIHSANPEIEKFGFWNMQIYYVLAGLLLGIMTIMDDRLELALGVHAATNIVGALFVGYEGAAIQTESLFKSSYVDTTLMTVGLVVIGAIFLLICSRKYNWGSFNQLIRPMGDHDSLKTDRA